MTEENQTANSGDEDMLQILLCYQKMALDKEKHSVLIKDKTMIQFLAYSLDSPDNQVVQTALKTIEVLAENPLNHSVLRSTFGVLEALKSTSDRLELETDVLSLATALHEKLEITGPAFCTRSRINQINQQSDGNVKKKLTSNVYSFHIFGLNNMTRDDLESTVVRVRGVVSVVVDTEHQRCIVRAVEKVTPEILVKAISEKANLRAHLIVKNKHNQEVLKDLMGTKSGEGDIAKGNSPNYSQEENVEDEVLPPYLPEEDTPVKEKAIHPFDKFKTNAVCWMKTATSLFQNSFYW